MIIPMSRAVMIRIAVMWLLDFISMASNSQVGVDTLFEVLTKVHNVWRA